ncbi:LysR family transcriptional regulator [Vibrio aquaticus]|uniref:LysR family transcriptional regulator n=1 Tax=Vibrio aquaticus TaxID=2496559 RepID=A0A3S0QFJ5_9VIBR|nr:LysR family transcriptional regulator [Vibrio aquaticus]RTZ17856.1 LysR family transcriptional regulator [Vibrio aquaticus]
MNLNFIKHFLAVYDFGSITKAAEHMDMTQPSMSSAIKKFEESYGQPLFLKVGRTIQPTEAADSLAYQMRPIMEQLDQALYSQRQLVVCGPEIILQSLPNMDGVLLTESPAIEYRMLDKIRSGEVDLLFDDITVDDHTFVTEEIGEYKIGFACRHDHPFIGETLSMTQFEQADHIRLRLQDRNVGALEARTDEIFKRKIVREVSGPSNLLLSVRNTDALCIVTESMFGLAEELGLKVLASPFPIRPYQLKLIYHRRHLTNKAHKDVRESIKHHLTKPLN